MLAAIPSVGGGSWPFAVTVSPQWPLAAPLARPRRRPGAILAGSLWPVSPSKSERTPLVRMLPRDIGGPAWDRGRVLMPGRIPWPLSAKAAAVADMVWSL
jgi:hypothetical protein